MLGTVADWHHYYILKYWHFQILPSLKYQICYQQDANNKSLLVLSNGRSVITTTAVNNDKFFISKYQHQANDFLQICKNKIIYDDDYVSHLMKKNVQNHFQKIFFINIKWDEGNWRFHLTNNISESVVLVPIGNLVAEYQIINVLQR